MVIVGIGLAAGAGVFAIAALVFQVPRQLVGGLGLAVAGAMVAWGQAPVSTFKREIKAHILTGLAGRYGLRYSERPIQPRPDRAFASMGLLPKYDRLAFEDYFEGEVRGVRVSLCEAQLKVRRGGGKRKTEHVVFQGVLATLAFPKRFQGQTVVVSDAGILNWVERFQRDGERVSLEDPAFEGAFEVYSTDQVEARYLLTPTFMERLLALHRSLGGKPLQAGFRDENLHLAMDLRRPLFELKSVYEPLGQEATLARFEEEMTLFYDLIDGLRLDAPTHV